MSRRSSRSKSLDLISIMKAMEDMERLKEEMSDLDEEDEDDDDGGVAAGPGRRGRAHRRGGGDDDDHRFGGDTTGDEDEPGIPVGGDEGSDDYAGLEDGSGDMMMMDYIDDDDDDDDDDDSAVDDEEGDEDFLADDEYDGGGDRQHGGRGGVGGGGAAALQGGGVEQELYLEEYFTPTLLAVEETTEVSHEDEFPLAAEEDGDDQDAINAAINAAMRRTSPGLGPLYEVAAEGGSSSNMFAEEGEDDEEDEHQRQHRQQQQQQQQPPELQAAYQRHLQMIVEQQKKDNEFKKYYEDYGGSNTGSSDQGAGGDGEEDEDAIIMAAASGFGTGRASGLRSSGMRNSGYRYSGYRHSGYRNSGYRASGVSKRLSSASIASIRSSLGDQSSSEGEFSCASAPLAGTGRADDASPSQQRQTRRTTINIPKREVDDLMTDGSSGRGTSTGGAARRRYSRRSIRASAISNLTGEEFQPGTPSSVASSSASVYSSASSIFSTLRARTSLLYSTRGRASVTAARSGSGSSSPVVSQQSASHDSNNTSGAIDMVAAVDRLGMHDQNTDWENAAAAAAVVAATTQAPARTYIQFRADEYVLVLLNLLNITNRQDDKSYFTVEPVNKYGFPAGEGKTEEQRQGPYSFVLCQVCKVHFDEDERYYTVRRADTGSEQRADPGWMHPVEGGQSVLEVAMKAAERTGCADADSPGQRHAEQQGVCSCVAGSLWWPVQFARDNMIPCYKSTREASKTLLENLLRGSKGYACRFKLSFINFLVLCSFIYLLIEPFTLAFLPPYLDYGATILELVVWIILLLELFFEFLIRPRNYHKLMESDKAYYPSTARHINRFHLVCELLALILFIPQLVCLSRNQDQCAGSGHGVLSFASLNAVLGETYQASSLGRFIIGLSFLRIIGLVRHWKKMWINDTFYGGDGPENPFLRLFLLGEFNGFPLNMFSRKRKLKVESDLNETETDVGTTKAGSEEDKKLQMNATIGTALMVVNSHRALFLLLLITVVFPVIYSLGRTNSAGAGLVELLQSNNIAANTTSDCAYLESAVLSWLRGSASEQTQYDIYSSGTPDVFLLWAQVLPVRCDWQKQYPYVKGDGVITHCRESMMEDYKPCEVWSDTSPPSVAEATPEYFAEETGQRVEGFLVKELSETASWNGTDEIFTVRVIVDENSTLSFTMSSLFILLVLILFGALTGLSIMRRDAQRLVLDPLQRMLRIVIRYAENPLAPTPMVSGVSKGQTSSDTRANKSVELGTYETEQLITAISKIADLLRKCWGVAGAGIISSNLARTKDGKTVVFNPTVPGKRVYALFGFIAINDFSMLLTALENDVMVLINDVARVMHDEVYRWALGDSGQCNKNLGAAFLMVFRIGDFTEVQDKKKRATDVVFNSQMTRNAKSRRRSVLRRGGKRNRAVRQDGNENLQLASLPGIQTFTDRALLGLLKSFAGLHRDQRMKEWEKDLRLGAGVGAFRTSVIYGMDAGWAVEGAVGSEHKIDATYLSPHVNMASRMMSATKQYGVTILLSQAVEELLSKQARERLRHLDTVYVKGSSVAQRIFTYDARYEGVDFFLFDRLPDQADRDAELYNPMVWTVDQDLKAMRQHVTDAFMEKFKEGLDKYLEGDWTAAVETLYEADELMIRCVMEEGYVEIDLTEGLEFEVFNRKTRNEEVTRIRNEYGDGACKCLISYMNRRKCKPPTDWQGVRHLMSK